MVCNHWVERVPVPQVQPEYGAVDKQGPDWNKGRGTIVWYVRKQRFGDCGLPGTGGNPVAT